MIKEFQGKYRWLSNFAPVKIVLDEIEYQSVEHAYQSCKSNDVSWKKFCSNINNTAGRVKKESRTVNLVENWNTIKLEVMEKCVDQKFDQEPYKSLLINTGNEFIQEGNTWNDTYWGISLKSGIGKNMLGNLIMNKRKSLIESK